MGSIIEVANKHRPELGQYAIPDYQLAALLTSFEREFQKQQYKDAISLLNQFPPPNI